MVAPLVSCWHSLSNSLQESLLGHLDLVVNFAGPGDLGRDVSNRFFLIFAVDRTAQRHFSILCDDLDVMGVGGQLLIDDLFANRRSEINVGFVFVLIDWRFACRVAVAGVDGGVGGFGRCGIGGLAG